jgi:hypothetical protein
MDRVPQIVMMKTRASRCSMECARLWVKEDGVALLRSSPGTMPLQDMARGGQWSTAPLGTWEHAQTG